MDNVKWKESMLEKISRFCLMDDTFFNVCMDVSPECVQLILQIIMNKNDLQLSGWRFLIAHF